MTTESNKQKIAKIHDIFPLATKDQIAKVLQYYDDDESQALDAITRDGGREAISNWAESVNAKSKNNKNKKKKKKGKKEPGFAGSATASFDADDSSSLHSSGNVDAEVERECPIFEIKNGALDNADDNKLVTRERLNVSEIEVSCSAPNSESVVRPEASISSVPDDSKCAIAESENPACASPVSSNSDKQDEPGSKRDKYRSVKDEGHGKYASRQRTNSFRRSKTSSFSEDSATLHNPPNSAAATKRGYEKCKKDLNRQTISLQRIHAQVDKGLEESSKKLKNVFNDLRKMLDQRQEQIEQELAKTKEDALNLLKSRQDLAVELKRRVDRTPSLSEAEWSELRLDVKQFVTERKYDDELGKTIWFQWSVDSINESISNFGEVHPVKNVYSQRSHSALSNVMASHNPEPSPSSSVANEEISSAADKNDVANMLDTVEDEIPVVKQEVSVPPPRNQPSENRSRVFSNTKFQINRARGYNRGNRGYGYSRPNNRNNYRNNYGNYEYSDYRNHPHQERDGRIHNNVVFSNDRNMNNHRNNRNDRRGPSMNYRPNVGRAPYRGNMGQQRQNAENYVKTDPGAAENPVENEKSNVMNGYMNN